MRQCIQSILSVLYPIDCVLCGRTLHLSRTSSHPLCSDCYEDLMHRYNRSGMCVVCSTPVISEKNVCLRCRERSYSFERNHSLFTYRGKEKEIVQKYKFEKRMELAPFFAEVVFKAYNALYNGLPVVPIPSHKKFTSNRKDQLLPITNILKRKYSVPIWNILGRIKNNPQKALNYEQRLENMKNALYIKTESSLLKCSGLVLFDDVITTGSTLHEAATVLKKAGVPTVFCITLAID